MSYSGDTIQATIDDSNKDKLNSLLGAFNSIKNKSSEAAQSLTGKSTLKGMEEINELMASAMSEIAKFSDTGKETGFFSSAKSKALAVVDPNSSWVGKWMHKAADEVAREELKTKSISEVITSVKNSIESKREEVITFIEYACSVRDSLIDSVQQYKAVEKEASKALEDAPANSRENYDAKMLITMIKQAIIKIEGDLKSSIEPLITSADISVQKIQTMLPSIEEDLQSKLGFKAFQQQLADLNGMTMAVLELSTAVGSKLRDDIKGTIYESIEMLSKTGVDVKELETLAQKEVAHQNKVRDLMMKTKQKMDDEFEGIGRLQEKLALEAAKNPTVLIESRK